MLSESDTYIRETSRRDEFHSRNSTFCEYEQAELVAVEGARVDALEHFRRQSGFFQAAAKGWVAGVHAPVRLGARLQLTADSGYEQLVLVGDLARPRDRLEQLQAARRAALRSVALSLDERQGF